MTKLLSRLASPKSGTVLAATAVALMSLHGQASTGRDVAVAAHQAGALAGITAVTVAPSIYHPPYS